MRRALVIVLLAAVSCGSTTNMAPDGSADGPTQSVLDPAPNQNTPGQYGCPGCPTSDQTQFNVTAGNATTRAFNGTVMGAMGNGTFYIVKTSPQGSPLTLESSDGDKVLAQTTTTGGQEVVGTIPTNASNGTYSFTAPLFCGEQLVKCVWSNAAGKYVLVIKVVTMNCVEPDIRVTIAWDNLGLDWELHLIKQGGKINDNATDCTWTSCISTAPDWGVPGDATDNPKKDVDNTGNYGPENIFLSKPENGVYTVMVEHWGSGTPDSDGSAIFNVKGMVTVVKFENLASRHVWTAGTIEWPSGVVTTKQDNYDCSANWSGGCKASIP